MHTKAKGFITSYHWINWKPSGFSVSVENVMVFDAETTWFETWDE